MLEAPMERQTQEEAVEGLELMVLTEGMVAQELSSLLTLQTDQTA